MLLWVSSVIDHRRRQNVVKKKRGTQAAGECVTDVFTTFWSLLSDLATERNVSWRRARANQTTGLTNGCAANWALEVEFSPFCPRCFFLSRPLLFFLVLLVFMKFLRNVFQHLHSLKAEWWRKHFAKQRASRSDDTRWQLLWRFLAV